LVRQRDENIVDAQYRGSPVGEQSVGARRRSAINRSGHGHHRYRTFDGLARGDQRPAALARLDHNHDFRQRGGDAIAQREPMCFGRRAWRRLTEQQPGGADGRPQVGVFARVDHVVTAGDDADRSTNAVG